MFVKQFLFSSAACVLATACATIPLTSMYKLRKFDLTTTDIAVLRVAVQKPRYIGISKGGAKMVVSAEKKDGSYSQSQDFVLDELPKGSVDASQLPNPVKWSDISGYRIALKDIGRLRALRMNIAQMKKQHGDQIAGSLSVSVEGCTRMAPPDGPVPITVWIKSEETEQYVVLLENIDLRQIMTQGNQSMELRPCKN